MAEGSGVSSSAQAEQQRLLQEAARQPGVADALAAFESVKPFLPPPTIPQQVTTLSTGGNTR